MLIDSCDAFPFPGLSEVSFCNAFYIGKTERRLHDRKTKHFKALTSTNQVSAVADYMTLAGHWIKWDHFDILATR